jgi:GAF domain-containing protein
VLVDAAPFEAATWASTLGPESSLPGRVWASRAPGCIPDVVQDPGLLRAPLAARAGLHAACGFPIVLGGDVLGVIEVFSQAVRHPDPDLVTLMATLGSQIGQFIERQRAEEALRQAQAELAHATHIWCKIQRAKG